MGAPLPARCRQRSEAAKEQPRTDTGFAEKQVVRQSVAPPVHKEAQAKASASKTNPGAVARGDALIKARPDLADDVRLGRLKPAAAHRKMKRDQVKAKAAELPKGKYRIIYADPASYPKRKRYGAKVDALHPLPPLTLTESDKRLDIP